MPDYLPVKQLDPRVTPKRVCTHVGLERIISQLSGKHAETLKHELRLAYSRFLNDGYFSFNRICFDALHGSYCRKQFHDILKGCTEVVSNHSAGHRSKRRVFTFGGVQKAPTYSGTCYSLDESLHTWHVIPAEWLWNRYERWNLYCAENNLKQNVDFEGTTPWGEAVFDSLNTVRIPTISKHISKRSGDSNPGQQQLNRLTQRGVIRLAFRRHGRCYGPLTNLNSTDRARILFDDTVGEVDMKACHSTLLASLLPQGAQNAMRLSIENGFYMQFDEAYKAFAIAKRQEMAEAGATQEAIEDRLKGVKVEFQRQCLFTRDLSREANPLWEVLRQNHPGYAYLVRRLNRTWGASGFACMMQRMESRLFVDAVIPALRREGITVLGTHDGLVVATKHLQRTKQILLDHASRMLGFVPSVAIKGLQMMELDK